MKEFSVGANETLSTEPDTKQGQKCSQSLGINSKTDNIFTVRRYHVKLKSLSTSLTFIHYLFLLVTSPSYLRMLQSLL